MNRILALLLTLATVSSTTVQAADVFDRHTGYWLKRAAEGSEPVDAVTEADARALEPLEPSQQSRCVVVKTDKGNWAKALVAWAFVRGPEQPVPVLLLERYVTYQSGKENVATAHGENVVLFTGFDIDLDLGQVVPEGLGGDIRFVKGALVPIGAARLFALDGSQLPSPDRDDERYDPTDHREVRPRDFSGTWRVNIDGRWRGEWLLEVEQTGRVRGQFLSRESKSSYPITGRPAQHPHHVKMTVHFESGPQSIDGYLWTTDKSTMAGTAELAGRTFGFYANRVVSKGPETEADDNAE